MALALWAILVVAAAPLLVAGAPATTSKPDEVKYLFTLGDSYTMTGFNVSGTLPSTSNPLGNPPPPGWTSSGGDNWLTWLVTNLKPVPLLSYNFASGGATTDATLVKPWQSAGVLSMVDQTKQLVDYVASVKDKPWKAETALLAIWFGINDVGNTYANDHDKLYGQIMDTYFAQVQKLYDAGFRHFALLTVPPLTSTPMMLAQILKNPEVKTKGDAAIKQYNKLLEDRLKEFSAKHDGVVGTVIATSKPFHTALEAPSKFNAPDNKCADVTKHCLWMNDLHPGVEIHKLIAAEVVTCLKKTFF